MKLAMIGSSKMGYNLTFDMMNNGHEVVGQQLLCNEGDHAVAKK